MVDKVTVWGSSDSDVLEPNEIRGSSLATDAFNCALDKGLSPEDAMFYLMATEAELTVQNPVSMGALLEALDKGLNQSEALNHIRVKKGLKPLSKAPKMVTL